MFVMCYYMSLGGVVGVSSYVVSLFVFVLYIASFFSYVVICVVYSLYVCKSHTHNDISDTKNDTKRYTYIERHRTTHETTTYKEPLNSFYVINKKLLGCCWGVGGCVVCLQTPNLPKHKNIVDITYESNNYDNSDIPHRHKPPTLKTLF